MTDVEKQKILDLRLKGLGYKAIAIRLNLSRDTVRKYCQRQNLNGVATAAKLNFEEKAEQGLACKNCGKEITQPSNRGRPKKFCSDKCRYRWWSDNYDAHNLSTAAFYKVKCAYCGKEFTSYGNQKRKFCSHECYIKSRFGGKNDDGTY